MMSQINYQPDFSHTPGDYLSEVLEARGIKKVDLALRCGRPTKTISEIISGKTSVTPETAIQFERVLGISASTWLNFETNHRLFLAQKKEWEGLEQYKDWAKSFPLKDLEKREYLTPTSDWAEKVKQLLDFLGVGSVDAWENYWSDQHTSAAYRKAHSHIAKDHAVSAWLRIGEREAANADCLGYDSKCFREALHKIRGLTIKPFEDFIEPMQELCANCGVIVRVIPELTGTRLSGAARWLSKDKALIQLSERYKTDDQFWFSFFHEAGHILLHSKKSTYIDQGNNVSLEIEKEEWEANKFAEDLLFPESMMREFNSRYPLDKAKKIRRYTSDNVLEFSEEKGIAPGIVAGRIQHKVPSLRQGQLNKLKRRIFD